LPSDNRFLTSLKLELAYFSGRAWLRGREVGGAGVQRPLSAAQSPVNHPEISRSHDPGVEALEI
jgi:hypothetical protein